MLNEKTLFPMFENYYQLFTEDETTAAPMFTEFIGNTYSKTEDYKKLHAEMLTKMRKFWLNKINNELEPELQEEAKKFVEMQIKAARKLLKDSTKNG